MSADVRVLTKPAAPPTRAADAFAQRRNVYSQHGEDGVLEWVLTKLGIGAGYFCEFGAWDGKHFSNCRYLYEKGWRGLFIEGDAARFADLAATYAGEGRIAVVNDYVRAQGASSLDAIFARHGIGSLDLLSIDIDGDDLTIWRSLRSVRPAVVIIEYNPTIPFDTLYENPQGENKGNSALAIAEHAAATGYALVAGTASNLIFVDEARRSADLPRLTLAQLAQTCRGSRFFFGYDGEMIVDTGAASASREYFAVPWTRFVGTQPVPKFLRGYERLQRTRLLYSLLGLMVRRPLTLLRLVRNKARRAERKAD